MQYAYYFHIVGHYTQPDIYIDIHHFHSQVDMFLHSGKDYFDMRLEFHIEFP
jgi:hypothetical protein